MLQKADNTLVHAQLNVALGAEGGIRSDSNAKRVCQIHEVLLRQVWMEFNLQDLRLVTSVGQDVTDEHALSVAGGRSRYECVVQKDEFKYLIPMFLARPSSTSSSMAPQVSWNGVFSVYMSSLFTSGYYFSSLTEIDLSVVAPPLWRVAVRRIHILVDLALYALARILGPLTFSEIGK